jgi:ubiquinone/menaquinone biosynthesis C-methylase UbiE
MVAVETVEKVNADKVRDYFCGEKVLEYYAHAATSIGLWESESKVFQRVFSDKSASLLELGCGCGRISFGLWELGYKHLLATDFSRKMIERARRLGRALDYGVHLRVADATRLAFEDDLFDGAVFGFNGLMQIPARINRRKAMSEIFRVLRAGSYFVFTTHDRECAKWKKFWKREKLAWRKEKQIPELIEYGDRFESTDMGKLYIHVPTKADVMSDLREAGFKVEVDALRSQLANEGALVRKFSDECRFWVARKPETVSTPD